MFLVLLIRRLGFFMVVICFPFFAFPFLFLVLVCGPLVPAVPGFRACWVLTLTVHKVFEILPVDWPSKNNALANQ